MFNNPELSRSTLSPFTPRNTSRRSVSSPGQSGRLFPRSSRSGTQSRSLSIPARVIEETPLHRVETYGLALPVQVNEIVAAAKERTPPVSVHLDPSGWAWLVFERRLLVWRYRSTEKSKATFCKEFVLPPTELYHSAKLVCLVATAGVDSRQYGVLAVSPEGLACYWPSMMYESNPIETQTDLVGQEFFSLVEFQPHGYILSTTTNDILLLSIQKKSIVFHRFRQPGGVFSGFGRRMSSFIFGAEDSSSSILRKIVVERGTQESLRSFYVLSGNTLRKWSVDSHGRSTITEKTEADWNVGALFEQQTSQRFQVDLDKVKSFCIDAQQSSTGISVLSAMLVQNPDLDEARMYYFLGTIDVNEDSDTYGRFISFVQLRFAEEYKEELHQRLVDFHLLIPATSKHAFLYSDNIIVCFAIKTTDDELNKAEFFAEGEVIWGSGFSDDAALFFVRKHGIINITATTNTESASEAEHMVTSQRLNDTAVHEDKVGKGDNLTTLRAAFLQFCQGNKEQAQTMCEDQFEEVSQTGDVSSLDTAVVNISQEIIDDYPASDPRWAEAVPADSGSSSASLIIIHQLEDKLKAHDYFVQFLKEVMLFQKLSTIQQFGRLVNTRHLLCGHAEKLKFAIALRRQHNKYQELVDGAIELVMKHRDQDSAPKGLTQQDLFYREVSRISDIISGLVDYEKYKLSQQPTQQDYQETILAVNSILESSLQEAWQYRQVNDELYTSSRDDEILVEYLPWTASSGPDGTRILLLEQLEISRERALNLAEDQKTKAVLVQQLVNLADILLDGYVTQLDSLRNFDDQSRFAETAQKYEHDRHQVIYPLVSRGYMEEALSLAEKYRNFDILIEICEELQDQDKLQHYMNLFNNENFSDFAFKWYMDRGKRSRLMSQPTNQHENLSKFLSSHDHLKWLHDIERLSFYQAFDTLKDLAGKEDLYVERKKTLLSLAKLALLASDESDEDETVQILEDITNQQTLITHQENIPVEILQNVSMDPTQIPPLSPEQLIEFYISDVNRNRDESDFKKALDVLHIAYMDESLRDEYEALRLRIWSQAILVDDWEDVRSDDPLLVARNTVFFKTVEIAFHEGFDLSLYMPSFESFLNCEDLKTAGLTENATFQFVLRAGYEQIMRTQNDIDMT